MEIFSSNSSSLYIFSGYQHAPRFFLISSSLAYMDRISISLNRNDMKIISATEHFVILGEIVVRVVVVVAVVDDAGGISKKTKPLHGHATKKRMHVQHRTTCTTPKCVYGICTGHVCRTTSAVNIYLYIGIYTCIYTYNCTMTINKK